jgi:CBS domain-containing protein
MTPDVVTVADDMSTHEAARFFIEHEISGAPVVDDQGRLVGVVSLTDIVRSVTEEDDEGDRPGRSAFYRGDVGDITLEDLGQRFVEQQARSVRDVMTPTIHAVKDSDPVAVVAKAMLDQHIHRLIVMRGADVVGIISSLDLLKVLAGRG